MPHSFDVAMGCLLLSAALAVWKRLGAAPAITALAAGLGLAGWDGAAALLRGAGPPAATASAALPQFPLALTRLSAFFLLLIALVSAPVALHAVSYVRRHFRPNRARAFWALLALFVLSMMIVVTAANVFAFLFGWELMTLFSAGLIALEGDSPERRHNLLIYVVMMHAGAAAVASAFFLFASGGATLSFAGMGAAALTPGVRSAIFLLAVVGFGVKAGLVPLHLWLPRAHPLAPSPVSALMSAVMLKTAVYGFILVCFVLLGPGPAWWGYLTLGLAAVTALLGVLFALGERSLKRVLAYSSIENLGLIFLGLGAALVFRSGGATAWAALALLAALLHTLNHALGKGLLFLGAGTVGQSAGSMELDQLGGLQRRMPMAGGAFLIGCGCLAGVPLLNGFVSEWLLLRALLAGPALGEGGKAFALPLLSGVLGLVGGLAAACFVMLYGVAFLGRPRSEAAANAPAPDRITTLALAALAAACLLTGIFPGWILFPLAGLTAQILGATAPLPAVGAVARLLPWLGLGAALTAGALAWRRRRRQAPTWACGLPALGPRMQYSAASFSKPLRTAFAFVYQSTRETRRWPADEPYFPAAVAYSSVRTTSFERKLYRPLAGWVLTAAQRLRRLHSGDIQAYLLYIFLALMALLLTLTGAGPSAATPRVPLGRSASLGPFSSQAGAPARRGRASSTPRSGPRSEISRSPRAALPAGKRRGPRERGRP